MQLTVVPLPAQKMLGNQSLSHSDKKIPKVSRLKSIPLENHQKTGLTAPKNYKTLSDFCYFIIPRQEEKICKKRPSVVKIRRTTPMFFPYDDDEDSTQLPARCGLLRPYILTTSSDAAKMLIFFL